MEVGVAITSFVVAAGLITVFGLRLATVVDVLADRTGIGGTLVGAFLTSIVTSLPELVTSVAAILGVGLIRRQRSGIGFEGVAILGLYAAGVVVVSLIG
ncbi:MAG: hypothetical protein U5K29_07100 [Acidimicrobiales bacterium]|nr:hypothetical protein [Acidimicrobiales bacterium]